jgi:hypothetical protein
MKWTLFFLLAVASASAQTYLKPYSLSLGLTEKFDQKTMGPTATTSPYSFANALMLGLNYRTPQDRIKLGLSFSHTIQTGTNSVALEIRYNLLQWGKRPAKRITRPREMTQPPNDPAAK